ncbi:MAG: tryptophan--tRNA ligase [Methanobacteriaceae archaeon]
MLDPWRATGDIDYNKLLNQFGIAKFSDIIDKLNNPNCLMKRSVIFGHRDFDKVINIINKNSRNNIENNSDTNLDENNDINKDFAVVTGMMPSGKMHIGHKMVVDQLKWYQDLGAKLFLPIADMEAYAARDIGFEEAKELAIKEYLANYIALGLDLSSKNVNVYMQSKFAPVKDLTFHISKKVNFNQMKAIYGFNESTNLAHLHVPLVQVADILVPQLEEFGGPKHIVVPVGVDQDPHLRLTRDIASRLREDYGFIAPSSTYHRFLTGLTGGKMSSSQEKTAIFLNDTSKQAEKKVKSAKTGGRESLEEQKKLGGCPDNCVIYELLLYHLMDSDKDLQEVYNNCKSGTLLCGECKMRTAELMKFFFEKLSKKQEKSLKVAENIIDDMD